MRTRFLLSILAVASSLGATLTIAQVVAPSAGDPSPDDAAATATAPAEPAEPEPDISTKATTNETVALGELPGLAGRWMILNDLGLGDRIRTVPAFWEVTEQDGKPVVVERFVALSLELNAAVEKAHGAGEKWEPTDDELAAVRAAWDDLPDQMRGVAAVKNELWGQDAFIDQIKKEAVTKDADWVVRQSYQFVPGGNRPVRQVNIFGVLEETPRGFAGNYSGVAVAMAPFPIPIQYTGTFRMIRLDPAPAVGFLTRIADMFEGCGS